jgi:hypothetical protein
MKVLVLVVSLLLASSLQAQSPSGQRGPVHRFAAETFRHTKASFTDVRGRRIWRVYAIGTILIAGADLATSIKGRHQGLGESQPERFLIGQYPSTLKLTLAKVLGTTAQLALLHKFDELLVNSCVKEADDPSSRWNNPNIIAASHDPNSCALAIPLAGMVVWPYSTAVVVGNINYLNRGPSFYAPALKPDLSKVSFVKH